MKKVLQDIIVTYQAISCLLSSSLLLALCLLSSYLPFIPFLFFPSSFFVEPSPLSQQWILNNNKKKKTKKINICYCMLCLFVSEMECMLSILYVGQWSWGFCVMFEGLPIFCCCCFSSFSSSIVWNSCCCLLLLPLFGTLIVVIVVIVLGTWLLLLLLSLYYLGLGCSSFCYLVLLL